MEDFVNARVLEHVTLRSGGGMTEDIVWEKVGKILDIVAPGLRESQPSHLKKGGKEVQAAAQAGSTKHAVNRLAMAVKKIFFSMKSNLPALPERSPGSGARQMRFRARQMWTTQNIPHHLLVGRDKDEEVHTCIYRNNHIVEPTHAYATFVRHVLGGCLAQDNLEGMGKRPGPRGKLRCRSQVSVEVYGVQSPRAVGRHASQWVTNTPVCFHPLLVNRTHTYILVVPANSWTPTWTVLHTPPCRRKSPNDLTRRKMTRLQ